MFVMKNILKNTYRLLIFYRLVGLLDGFFNGALIVNRFDPLALRCFAFVNPYRVRVLLPCLFHLPSLFLHSCLYT